MLYQNVVDANVDELAAEDFNLDEYVSVLSKSVVGENTPEN